MATLANVLVCLFGCATLGKVSAEEVSGAVVRTDETWLGASQVESEDLCGDNCTMVDRMLHFPSRVEGLTLSFNWSLSGQLTEAVAFSWRYAIRVDIDGIMFWNSTGVACGEALNGDHIWTRLELGLPSCTAQPGEVTIPGSVFFSIPPLPLVRTTVTIRVHNDVGADVFHFALHLKYGGHATEREEVANPLLFQRVDDAMMAVNRGAEGGLLPHTTITDRDCCDETCLLTNASWHFPSHFTGDSFAFSGNGMMSRQLDSIRFGVHTMWYAAGELPVHILLGNGSACGPWTTTDHFEVDLDIDFPSCPAHRGPYSVGGRVRLTLPLDAIGRIVLRVDATDEVSGSRVACSETTLRFNYAVAEPLLMTALV